MSLNSNSFIAGIAPVILQVLVLILIWLGFRAMCGSSIAKKKFKYKFIGSVLLNKDL